MTLICQKEIELCISVQKNLDAIRKLYNEVKQIHVNSKQYAKQTLDICEIDYDIKYWDIRELITFDDRIHRLQNDSSERIFDPGVKIVYSIMEDHPLLKSNLLVSGMNFTITKNYFSYVSVQSGFALMYSTNPHWSDRVYMINYEIVNLSVEEVNNQYDINLPLDISTWTEDDLLMLRMCV